MNRSLALVIPALNESKTIKKVVTSISRFGQVIVVDDGSTDETSRVAEDAGAIVVRHLFNKGYDRALASGLEEAIDAGYQYAITLDADGQHSSGAVREVFARLLDGADLVVGIRDRHQRVAEVLFASVSFVFWQIADPLCGLKGYKLARLKTLIPLRTYDSVGTELTLIGARSGWCIEQVPIITNIRAGSTRFGGGLYANWLIFKALLAGLLNRRRSI